VRLVQVDEGVRLAVQEFGDGPPVVFVHGGAFTHAGWDHQVAALMPSYRTVTYDLRGCGGSDRPPAGYSVDRYAEDLGALLRALGLERPVLVGHGLGAHVALRCAADRADDIAGLVLVAAAPWFVGDRDGAGGFPDALWERMRSGAARSRAEADLALIDGSFFHRPPSEAVRLWCLKLALEWPLPVFRLLSASLRSVDHRAYAGAVRVPTLLIHGRHDRKTRYEGAQHLAELLPQAELATFEESAHCPQLEEVERFNAVLADFLSRLTAGAAGRRANAAATGPG
jgi:non-heme chloroperoxidase